MGFEIDIMDYLLEFTVLGFIVIGINLLNRPEKQAQYVGVFLLNFSLFTFGMFLWFDILKMVVSLVLK